jgi:hypothetical protein
VCNRYVVWTSLCAREVQRVCHGPSGPEIDAQQSLKPVTAESIRQVDGWTSAWAGIKLAAAVSTAVGGLIGGVAGYCFFDWAADQIDEN